MGHRIGDGIVVMAIAAGFVGYWYFRHRERQRRLEIVHAERMAAMDKGIPLPELPIDPPHTPAPPDPRWPLVAGIVLTTLGGGAMAALNLSEVTHHVWSLPLPLATVGVGFLLFYFLATERS